MGKTVLKRLDKFFAISENKSSFKTEIIAGITIFLTMVYIIAVNPGILSDAGMDFNGVFVATILATAIGTLIMGLYAKRPIGIAPGMGLNAFFTYGIVLGMGHSRQAALGAVFISGIIFVIISVTPIRQIIIKSIPNNLKIGIGVGVGLFLLLIGLKSAGIVVANEATLIGLGNLGSTEVLLALLGFLIILVLDLRKIKGSIILSIVLITILSFFLAGNEFLGIISAIPDASGTLFQLDILGALKRSMLGVILSILFVDFFDTAGTLTAVTGELDPKKYSLEKSKKPFLADSLATTFGALFGTSNSTSYIESATGIKEGGRTGLTAVVVALLFILCLFFAPIFKSIPVYATAPALIYVGLLFFKNLKFLDLDNIEDIIPAGVAALMMPFTYSITNGIIFGFIVYVVIQIFTGKIKLILISVWVITILSILYLIL